MVSRTFSGRNSAALMPAWSRAPAATGWPLRVARRWPLPCRAMSAASMASWGQPYGAALSALCTSLPRMPEPTVASASLATGWSSVVWSHPTTLRGWSERSLARRTAASQARWSPSSKRGNRRASEASAPVLILSASPSPNTSLPPPCSTLAARITSRTISARPSSATRRRLSMLARASLPDSPDGMP